MGRPPGAEACGGGEVRRRPRRPEGAVAFAPSLARILAGSLRPPLRPWGRARGSGPAQGRAAAAPAPVPLPGAGISLSPGGPGLPGPEEKRAPVDTGVAEPPAGGHWSPGDQTAVAFPPRWGLEGGERRGAGRAAVLAVPARPPEQGGGQRFWPLLEGGCKILLLPAGCVLNRSGISP